MADPFKTVYVSPEQITHYILYPDVYTEFGSVKSGSWDKEVGRFNERDKYKSMNQRFKDGVEWSETGIFDYLLDLIEQNGTVDGCKSIEDLERRYKHIDELYDDIATNGFKSGDQLPSKRGDIADVCVAIGHDGSLIQHGDGIHRTAIAKILELPEIPVKVSVRHTEWQEVRERFAKGEPVDESYRDHPDLRDLR